MEKLGYTKFYKENNNVIGEYLFVLYDIVREGFPRDFREVVDESVEKKTERFFEYDISQCVGYYNYPVFLEGEEISVRLVLEDLTEFKNLSILRKYIKYNKKLKNFDYVIAEFFNKPIIISGKVNSINFVENCLTIGDKFIVDLIGNINLYRSSNDILTSDLVLMNYALKTNEKSSSITKHFLAHTINNIILNTQSKVQYDFIIDEMKDMIVSKVTEKEWQYYVHKNYRYLFPEYINIENEYLFKTIDLDKKYVDFKLRNQDNVLLLEIKLPSAPIMSSSKDRNNFYFVASMNKAVLQTYRYLDTYKRRLIEKGCDETVHAMLLVGTDELIKKGSIKQWNDFVLSRDLFNKIQIVTYTELLRKLENIRNLL